MKLFGMILFAAMLSVGTANANCSDPDGENPNVGGITTVWIPLPGLFQHEYKDKCNGNPSMGFWVKEGICTPKGAIAYKDLKCTLNQVCVPASNGAGHCQNLPPKPGSSNKPVELP
jgi:hypothetical protein